MDENVTEISSQGRQIMRALYPEMSDDEINRAWNRPTFFTNDLMGKLHPEMNYVERRVAFISPDFIRDHPEMSLEEIRKAWKEEEKDRKYKEGYDYKDFCYKMSIEHPEMSEDEILDKWEEELRRRKIKRMRL